jgi:SAM-dependent methyltransferase
LTGTKHEGLEGKNRMSMIGSNRGPADVYDELFVPALFQQWGPVVAGLAQVREGNNVLDVACGTGALTLALADIVGPTGSVVGLDANGEMLKVARSKSRRITWMEGRAEELPFPDNTMQAVVSQFGFMFFADRTAALREMLRVLSPGGYLAVAVCDAVQRSPGYSVLAELLDRLFGKSVGDAFRRPFVLGNPELLLGIARAAGLPNASVEARLGKVRFGSISALISTERACAWTLGGLLDDQQFSELEREAETALRPFVDGQGSVVFDMPALVLTARKSLPASA